MTATNLQPGPLDEVHRELGATMAEFGGWQMPIQYPDGVLEEHTVVREKVGVFDVSHLGKASVVGKGAAAFVNECLSNDLGRIGPGRAQYTLCCTETGGVVDDLIVYLVGDDEVFAVPNAANTAEVTARLKAAAPAGVTVTDRHTDYGVLAVQGPASARVLQALGLPSELEYMAFTDADWDGRAVRVCRTGYTGEHGYELLPAWDDTPALGAALTDAAATLHGRPCGLGARDTLRTEMGYPLHGQDLSQDISPVQAGLGWAVGWRKPAFWGRDALLAEREAGPARRLWGLRATGRGVPRAHMPVLAGGQRIGETTSGTFSPTLRTGIALALLDSAAFGAASGAASGAAGAAGLEAGATVSVDVRGRALECTVVKPPFVVPHVR